MRRHAYFNSKYFCVQWGLLTARYVCIGLQPYIGVVYDDTYQIRTV